MASNMTTKEKLMHPVTAVKEMMGKGDSHTTDTTTGTHTGAHTGTHTTGTHMTGTHTGTHLSSKTNEAGVIGRYEVPMTGVTQTTPTTMGNEEQLMTNELGGTPTMGTTAGSGARPVFSETAGYQGDNRMGHHSHHTGTGVAGAGATGLAGYEAEKHLGHHGQHTGTGVAGAGATGLAGYEAEKHLGHHGQHTGTGVGGAGATGLAGYEAEKHLGQHGQHTGHHMGQNVGAMGTTGVGAYEAEKHLGQHNRHNDASILANTPGLPGTTGTRGEVFTPNDPRPHNAGLNVIGMNTPHNTSDVRSYDNPTAQSVPHTTTPSHVNQDRLAATSLPANPVMSALTGGKIPPSIHKGYEQAGVYDGANTGTGVSDANRNGVRDTTTGVHDTTRVGHTGARRDVI